MTLSIFTLLIIVYRVLLTGSYLTSFTDRIDTFATLGFWCLVVEVITQDIQRPQSSDKKHPQKDLHQTIPAKALKAKAMSAAVTKAIGLPFQALGVLALSSLSLRQENRYKTNINPAGTAIELTIVSTRL